MKSLLLLLGCICLADGRRSKFPYEWESRIDSNYESEFDSAITDYPTDAGIRIHRGERHRKVVPLEDIEDRDHRGHRRVENPETHHPIRHGDRQFRSMGSPQNPTPINWPVKKEAVVEGDLVLGGLMMVHEREDSVTCGPVMPQGGVQALEAMLYTLDTLNSGAGIIPGVKIGAHILDDCDKDTYGLEMAVDFIKGKFLLKMIKFSGVRYIRNKNRGATVRCSIKSLLN